MHEFCVTIFNGFCYASYSPASFRTTVYIRTSMGDFFFPQQWLNNCKLLSDSYEVNPWAFDHFSLNNSRLGTLSIIEINFHQTTHQLNSEYIRYDSSAWFLIFGTYTHLNNIPVGLTSNWIKFLRMTLKIDIEWAMLIG